MWKNRGLAFKLILFFTTSSALIFLVVFSYNYWFSRRMIEESAEENARNLVLATVNKIEAVLRSVQKVPENLAYFMEYGSCDKEELLRLLREVVENNSEIYGSTFAFEPHAFEKKSLYFAPYFYKRKKEIAFAQLGNGKYHYFNLDWYQIPKELERPDWTEPYFDEGGGNILMSTYSVPFYKKVGEKRQFMGVVTADISLETLQNVVSSIKVLQTGYGFLISKNGTLVTHPQKELIMNETLFGVAEARGDGDLREIGRKMIRGESGFAPFRSLVSEEPCWIYYTPIPSSGWSLAVVFPKDEMMAGISRLNRIVASLGIAGVLLLSIAVIFIARSITKPLREMVQITKDIARGNLDIELPPVKSGDEVGKLSEAFLYMKESLREYIERLTETTASKERIESELKIAHDIQMSLLPKVFPPFPERQEFDVYAFIEAAREVGGDFYDFFFIDNEHLCFVIGDVSGKGVPASLFMAMTKTLIKAVASKGMTPGEILTKVNHELNQGNDSCMFVTIFFAVLDTRTGEVLYANGGHNPPLIIRMEKEVTFLEGKRGLVVGAMEDMIYETGQFVLQPGETLFLYTDGVTEAMDKEGDLFTDDRLKEEIMALQGRSMQDIIGEIMKEIISFSQGIDQSDDITMMMIQFKG